MNERAALVAATLLAVAPASASALTEAEVVEAVFARNPQLQAARKDSESARWSVVAEQGFFGPVLQLDANAVHTEQPSLEFERFGDTVIDRIDAGAGVRKRFDLGTDLALRLEASRDRSETRITDIGDTVTGPVYESVLRLELDQPLLRGAGREVNLAALRTAEAQRTESELAAERTGSALLRDALTAYWELWFAEESQAIEEESIRLAERQVDEARRRIRLGSEAPVAIYAFETRLAQRREDFAVAERSRAERAATLAQLLGTTGTSFDATPGSLEAGAVPEDAEALAAERSPELREARAAVEVTRIQSLTAADPFRSRLDVQAFAEAGRLAGDVNDLFGDQGRTGFSVGVGIVYELPLDGRQLRAARARASLALDAAELRLEQARLSNAADVSRELTRERSARERVALAEKTLEYAELQLEAEERRYATGGSTPLAVLEAEEDVRNARLGLARARVDLQNAVTSLRHLTGALVDGAVAG